MLRNGRKYKYNFTFHIINSVQQGLIVNTVKSCMNDTINRVEMFECLYTVNLAARVYMLVLHRSLYTKHHANEIITP